MAGGKAVTKGVHHVGLTVPDIRRTADFFTQSLGMSEVGGNPDYPSLFVSDGTVLLTIWQAEDPKTATAFDRRRNVGLHHLALAVESIAVLDQLHDRLAATPGVGIEFAPQEVGSIPFSHMMCLIPGGVRVEFIAPH
jgi:catechol 2,3-dioxygenase-like lactoylglutathione lyase family enzyme